MSVPNVVSQLIAIYRPTFSGDREAVLNLAVNSLYVRDWLASVKNSNSPLVNDLCGRVRRAIFPPSKFQQVRSGLEGLVSYIYDKYLSVRGILTDRALEEKILAKDFKALDRYFRANPEALLEHAPLIALHRDLKTLYID